MNILFFSKRFPLPMDTGGKIRTGKILEELNRLDSVTLVCHVESPQDQPYLGEVTRLCREFVPVSWKEIPKFSFLFYWRCVVGLFSRYPITVLNDFDKSLQKAVRDLLQKKTFDVLVCDFLQPSLNVMGIGGIPTILFQHNVEAEIPYRHYLHAPWFLKWFWRNQWKKMERFEGSACEWFSGVITVSEHDRTLLASRCQNSHIYPIPTGVDLDYFSPSSRNQEEEELVFTGSLDWLPNEDAILYFCYEILPLIKRKRSRIVFTVVGRNPSQVLLDRTRSHPEIRVVGRVPDIRPFVHSHKVFIIPLRIGGGTRIKAYEAMAMGKAVVSTSVGMEGLPVTHEKNVLLADTPERFAQAILELLDNDTKRTQLGCSAREFVAQEGGWENAGKTFRGICQKIVALGHPTSSIERTNS